MALVYLVALVVVVGWWISALLQMAAPRRPPEGEYVISTPAGGSSGATPTPFGGAGMQATNTPFDLESLGAIQRLPTLLPASATPARFWSPGLVTAAPTSTPAPTSTHWPTLTAPPSSTPRPTRTPTRDNRPLICGWNGCGADVEGIQLIATSPP